MKKFATVGLMVLLCSITVGISKESEAAKSSSIEGELGYTHGMYLLGDTILVVPDEKLADSLGDLAGKKITLSGKKIKCPSDISDDPADSCFEVSSIGGTEKVAQTPEMKKDATEAMVLAAAREKSYPSKKVKGARWTPGVCTLVHKGGNEYVGELAQKGTGVWVDRMSIEVISDGTNAQWREVR